SFSAPVDLADRFNRARFGRCAVHRVPQLRPPRNRGVQDCAGPAVGQSAAEKITDEDLLREVMNTVGKPGRLGEQVRCVVSVSMLTEGWDTSTVTHMRAVCAFGTQLLCEQVVGRGLRRLSYDPDAEGMLRPSEYATIFGIPFSFAQHNQGETT